MSRTGTQRRLGQHPPAAETTAGGSVSIPLVSGAPMFESETSMIEPLRAAALEGWAAADEPWMVVTEHRADTRIPDLVLARLNEAAVEARIKAGCTRPLRRKELAALLSLRLDCGTAFERVAAEAFVTPPSLRRTFRDLEADGFVHRTARDCWRRSVPLQPLVTRFVSFEAKRSDWRGALAQARVHRLFSNEAYVAFDASFARRFERGIAYYKNSGIGLIALGAEPGSVRRLLRGRRGRPLDQLSALLAGEEVWARLQGITRQLPQTRLPNAAAPNADRGEAHFVGGSANRLRPLLAGLAKPAPA